MGSQECKTGAESVSEQISSSSAAILHQSLFREETRDNIGLTVAIDVTCDFETEAEKASGNYFLVSLGLFDKSDRSRITLTRVKKIKKYRFQTRKVRKQKVDFLHRKSRKSYYLNKCICEEQMII